MLGISINKFINNSLKMSTSSASTQKFNIPRIKPDGTYDCPYCSFNTTCFTCPNCFSHVCDEHGCGHYVKANKDYCDLHK